MYYDTTYPILNLVAGDIQSLDQIDFILFFPHLTNAK